MLPDMPYMSVRLGALMSRKKLTTEQLSAASGVSGRSISAMLRGRQRSMTINVVAALSRELDVQMKDFIDYMCIDDFPEPVSISEIIKRSGGKRRAQNK